MWFITSRQYRFVSHGSCWHFSYSYCSEAKKSLLHVLHRDDELYLFINTISFCMWNFKVNRLFMSLWSL